MKAPKRASRGKIRVSEKTYEGKMHWLKTKAFSKGDIYHLIVI
jgi:hypothetical protein